MNTKKPRKQYNHHGVNLAREFMRKELTGDYTLADSAGNYLAPTDIVALWDDATIAKKFDIGVSSVLYLRRALNIPNVYERRKAVFAKLRQSPNGENCQTLQKSPVETLPAWLKVEQWVISKAELKLHQSVEACFLKQIDEVDLDGHILFKTRTGERVSDCWEKFIPVRFRPYTYCEAEGLLGKTMKCERDGKHSTHIVTFVQESSWHVEINGYPFTFLAEKCSATINGLPVGVPVVDEDVLKGGAK